MYGNTGRPTRRNLTRMGRGGNSETWCRARGEFWLREGIQVSRRASKESYGKEAEIANSVSGGSYRSEEK